MDFWDEEWDYSVLAVRFRRFGFERVLGVGDLLEGTGTDKLRPSKYIRTHWSSYPTFLKNICSSILGAVEQPVLSKALRTHREWADRQSVTTLYSFKVTISFDSI